MCWPASGVCRQPQRHVRAVEGSHRIEEAEAITALCHGGQFPDYSRYIGGVYSSEWFWAKILHVSRADAAVRATACNWVELCDWVPAILSGTQARPTSDAGAAPPATSPLAPELGRPAPAEFLNALDPLLTEDLDYPLFTDSWTADLPVGTLTPEWAERLHLSCEVVIAGGAFDCHMGRWGRGQQQCAGQSDRHLHLRHPDRRRSHHR